ncbi:opsin-3-like isoform X4 [Stigmatopora argus]
MFWDGAQNTSRSSGADPGTGNPGPGPGGHEWWSDAPRGQLTRGGHRVVSLFLGSIMVFGFVNNLLVLVLFCRFKTLRTPVNMLLLNISVSDMLVCACGTTLSFASSLRYRWLFGRMGCLWYGFVNSCFGIVSLVSLALLSYERYSTLLVYNKRALDYRKPLLAVCGAWLYSLAWTLPPLLGWSSYGLEGAGTSCSVTWTEPTSRSHSYIVCLFVFCLGLPVVLMAYCYGRLLHAVKQVGCQSGSNSKDEAARVPHPVHGRHHSGLLPRLLDAVRRRGHDGHIWSAGPHQPCGERGAVHPGQEQHRGQPGHLHPDEQAVPPLLPDPLPLPAPADRERTVCGVQNHYGPT